MGFGAIKKKSETGQYWNLEKEGIFDIGFKV